MYAYRHGIPLLVPLPTVRTGQILAVRAEGAAALREMIPRAPIRVIGTLLGQAAARVERGEGVAEPGRASWVPGAARAFRERGLVADGDRLEQLALAYPPAGEAPGPAKTLTELSERAPTPALAAIMRGEVNRLRRGERISSGLACQDIVSAFRRAGLTSDAARLAIVCAENAPPVVTPADAVRPGDVVQVPYRGSGADVIANHVLVTTVEPSAIRGYVGAVVYPDGRVDAWWSDRARMAAGARVGPASFRRATIQWVYRNGLRVA